MSLIHPDEWAVLLHQQGGRLFQVGSISDPENEGRYRVTEKDDRPRQPPHEVWNTQLVRVKDREAAVALVAVLGFIEGLHRASVQELEQRRDKWFKRAVGDYELFEGEAE